MFRDLEAFAFMILMWGSQEWGEWKWTPRNLVVLTRGIVELLRSKFLGGGRKWTDVFGR